jgi:hypothetical protein
MDSCHRVLRQAASPHTVTILPAPLRFADRGSVCGVRAAEPDDRMSLLPFRHSDLRLTHIIVVTYVLSRWGKITYNLLGVARGVVVWYGERP